MNRFLIALLTVFLLQSQSQAQSEELPKFEVAAEFATLHRESFSSRTDLGFGGRFTYNLNQVFSLEGVGYFFPKRCFGCPNEGNVAEVLGGVKVGKRFENWGIFAKARPGVASFSQGKVAIVQATAPFEIETHRLNTFAADIGGVVEFYPSKRIVARFDAGDTMIHFKRSEVPIFAYNPTTGTSTIIPFSIPARTAHTFQFMVSVGFRF
jgi:hypothetical protein